MNVAFRISYGTCAGVNTLKTLSDFFIETYNQSSDICRTCSKICIHLTEVPISLTK